jgi:GNAT superfamily N-acetyltransferase
VVADKKLSSAQLAKVSDADALAVLFCTGEKEICLKPYVCSPENRANLTELFRRKCSSRKIWIVRNLRTPIGMLVFGKRSKENGINRTEIDYVVVAPDFRGRGIGPILIKRIQSRKDVNSLRAEARNGSSKRMLIRCEFETDDTRSSSSHPIMTWQKKIDRLPDLN